MHNMHAKIEKKYPTTTISNNVHIHTIQTTEKHKTIVYRQFAHLCKLKTIIIIIFGYICKQ